MSREMYVFVSFSIYSINRFKTGQQFNILLSWLCIGIMLRWLQANCNYRLTHEVFCACKAQQWNTIQCINLILGFYQKIFSIIILNLVILLSPDAVYLKSYCWDNALYMPVFWVQFPDLRMTSFQNSPNGNKVKCWPVRGR